LPPGNRVRYLITVDDRNGISGCSALTSVLEASLLRTFIAIAEGGSIAAGARVEDISPSLASRRLQTLETSLDIRLFQRTTRKLQITEAGLTVLAWAKEALRHYEQMVDELGAQQKKPIGLVRVACNEYTGTRYLLQAITPFRRQHPGLRFLVTMADEPIRLIEGYDLVIHAGRLPDSNLIGRRIRSYHRILCAAPSYLAEHGAPSTPQDLAGHACLTHTRVEPRNWFFQKGDEPVIAQPVNPVVEVNAYLMLLDLALAGVGIIRISAAMVSGLIEAGRLVQVLGEFRCIGADGQDPAVWLIQPDRRLPYRVRLFADHLIRHLYEPP
jgi:LysR family transcriptional activator of dmlA